MIFSLDLAPIVLLRLLSWRTRFILDLHDAPRSSITKMIVYVSSLLCSRVVCISTFIARFVPAKKARVINRPIELGVKRPSSDSGRPFVVGIVGRVDPIKRIEIAVDAVAQLSADVRIEVRGESFVDVASYSRRLEVYAEQVLGSGRFVFTGKLPLDVLYDGLDLVVVANDREPSGRTVGEAQAVGVPVLVPDAGGAAEYVVDGLSGLHYRAGDSAAMADRILCLIEDAALRSNLGDAGRVSIERDRSPGAVAAEYRDAVLG
ncbi:glycosyltransferase family 4 protein [Pseudonocardia spirodelae]|uniref:Glycosyltransferase family 4 protein n=1 Tax=Pseudonocardia spirodelae TaxID=3133431 RepID=A0ABU8T3R2_9PSEU